MKTHIILAVLVAGLIGPGESENRGMFRKRQHTTLPTPANDSNNDFIKTNDFLTPLDHYGTVDGTFRNYYYVNNQFVVKDNPVMLVMIHNEVIGSPRLLGGGLIFELAREIGACMFLMLNRGYSQSKFNDSQYQDVQFPFLTNDQAVADVATFITSWKTDNPSYADSRVILFGGSLAGNRATWARIAYPDVVYGAIASSAPLLGKANFFEFLEVVSDAIATEASPMIVDVIRQGIAQAVELLKTEDGAKQLTSIFKLCADININNPLDIQVFFSFIIHYFADLVQYARPGEIALECMGLENEALSPLERLGDLLTTESYAYDCYSTNYTETVEYYKVPVNYPATLDIKAWLWQHCSEYGLFPYTDSENQPFGDVNPLSFYTDHLCPDIFGGLSSDVLRANIEARNLKYGGLNPNVERVVFVHGSIDPWSKLGVVEDLSEDLPALFIQGASRSRDHLATSIFDAPELTAARKVIRETVLKWINE